MGGNSPAQLLTVANPRGHPAEGVGVGVRCRWRAGDPRAPASLAPRDKYQVFDSAPRGLLRVEELEDQGQTLANVFILRLLENADDREATYMLKASSQ